MKTLIHIIIFILLINYGKAQNALGLSFGYGSFKANNWNSFLEKYNSNDTVISKQPFLKQFPSASILYERKLAEYFYLQGNLSFGFTNSISNQNGILKWEILAFGTLLAANWYPFKMIKGTSKTAFNPILFQLSFGANYMQKSLTLNGSRVIEPEKKGFSGKNIAIMVGTALGYDLHFGKRIVVQAAFDVKYIHALDMPELSYFVNDYEIAGLSTSSNAIIIGGKISLLFLFKRLRSGKNNIHSKKSMFS